MRHLATRRWPAPSPTGSCTTPTASSSRAKACASSGLPDESTHLRANLDECPAARCNALRDAIQAMIAPPKLQGHDMTKQAYEPPPP